MGHGRRRSADSSGGCVADHRSADPETGSAPRRRRSLHSATAHSAARWRSRRYRYRMRASLSRSTSERPSREVICFQSQRVWPGGHGMGAEHSKIIYFNNIRRKETAPTYRDRWYFWTKNLVVRFDRGRIRLGWGKQMPNMSPLSAPDADQAGSSRVFFRSSRMALVIGFGGRTRIAQRSAVSGKKHSTQRGAKVQQCLQDEPCGSTTWHCEGHPLRRQLRLKGIGTHSSYPTRYLRSGWRDMGEALVPKWKRVKAFGLAL